MYAIKPWGNALLVGCSIGSYAMGIGMRWRESNVTLVEQRSDPRYEKARHRRCLLTNYTVQLLVDLGCTEHKLRAILSPARGWRVLDAQLHVLHYGATFPDCTNADTVYHCSEGQLLSTLRSEFLRFGGSIQWASRVYEAQESKDGSNLWSVRKDYGPATGLGAILTTARATPLHPILFKAATNTQNITYEMCCGVSEMSNKDKEAVFGGGGSSSDDHALHDVAILMSRHGVIHMWLMSKTDNVCAWRITCPTAAAPSCVDAFTAAVPLVHRLVLSGKDTQSAVCVLPGVVPAVRNTALSARVSVLGNGLIPVDPFELRGDGAHCCIKEASHICRALYGKKYHRGDAASLLRGVEQECIARRFNLLSRDLHDVSRLVGAHAVLTSGQENVAAQVSLPDT